MSGRTLARVTVRDQRPPEARRNTRKIPLNPDREILFTPPEADLVRNALETELTKALAVRGVSRVKSLSCELTTFKVHTKTTLLYVDVVADIGLTLHHGSKRYSLAGSCTKRTPIWPGASLMAQAVEGSFADMEDDLERVARALAP